MREQGRLVEWNDERGFGFIIPLRGEARTFVHISEFPSGFRRPQASDLLTYAVERDNRNRLVAVNVRYLAPARKVASVKTLRSLPALIACVAFFGLLAWLTLGGLSPLVLLAYGALSAAAIISYGFDKLAAERQKWRTEEAALHMIALMGGWPGALVAQRVFHHKTRNASFQSVFWVTVILNCAGLIAAVILVRAING